MSNETGSQKVTPDPLAERLEKCYSGAVYDVLRSLGYPNQVLPPTIRPLEISTKLAGRVYTVSGYVDKTQGAHETLLGWTALLSKAPAGSVVICQPNDSSMAHMGELSAETLQFRGVRGYIVDGGCRDSAFISGIGFRVFSRYFTPVDVVGRWVADRYGEPITIGEVTISTGDYVMADRDGIVIIPAEMAEDVVTRTEEVLETESLVRKAILEGVDPQEAYLKYGKF
ncbi:MAG: RraA family protein [Trueperaceae bacterium]|nr:MAG: RraA family protein [Trueperaceae bacterium]